MRRRSDKTKDKEKEKEKSSEKKYEKTRHSHRNIRKRRKSSSSSEDSSSDESEKTSRKTKLSDISSSKKVDKPRASVTKTISKSESESEASTSRQHKSGKKHEPDNSAKVTSTTKKENVDEDWKEDKSFWEGGDDNKTEPPDQKHKDRDSKSSVWQVKTDTDGDGSKLKICIVRPTEPSGQSPRRRKRSGSHHHSHKDDSEIESSPEKKPLNESAEEKRKPRKSLKDDQDTLVSSSEKTDSAIKVDTNFENQMPLSLDDIELPAESQNIPTEKIKQKSNDVPSAEDADDNKGSVDNENINEQNLADIPEPEGAPSSDNQTKPEMAECKPESDESKLDKNLPEQEVQQNVEEQGKENLEVLEEKPAHTEDTNKLSPAENIQEESPPSEKVSSEKIDKLPTNENTEDRRHSVESNSSEKKFKNRDTSDERSDQRDSSEERYEESTPEERRKPRSSIHRPEIKEKINSEHQSRSRSSSSSSSGKENERGQSSDSEELHENKKKVDLKVADDEKNQNLSNEHLEKHSNEKESKNDVVKEEEAQSKPDMKSPDKDTELEKEKDIDKHVKTSVDSTIEAKKEAIRRKLNRALNSVDSRPVINRSHYKQLDFEDAAESSNASGKVSPLKTVEKEKPLSPSPQPPSQPQRKISLRRSFSSKSESTETVETEKVTNETETNDHKDNSVNQDLEEGEIANDPTPVIVRKRKWLSHRKKKPAVLKISSDSLKDLIPDAQPLELNEVELIEQVEEKSDIVILKEKKIKKREKVESYMKEMNEKNDDIEVISHRKVIAISDDKADRIFTRKISIVSDDARSLQRSPSPPRHKISNILHVTNLVRPFTVNQLRELLARTGNIVEGGFWIDKIKSKCYVEYENETQAKETRHALHGVRWPVSNPKQLFVDFGSKEDMERAQTLGDVEDEVPKKVFPISVEPLTPPVQKRIVDVVKEKDWDRTKEQVKEKPKHKEKLLLQNRLAPEERGKHSKAVPVREWDVGKSEHSSQECEMKHEERSKEKVREREKDRERERKPKKERIRRSRSSTPDAPVRKSKKKEEDVPAKMLDDLFKKTKASPCIYWLPLTPEQISVKEEMRRRHMAEHERRMAEIKKAEKEREKIRAQQREKRHAASDRDRRRRHSSGSRTPKK